MTKYGINKFSREPLSENESDETRFFLSKNLDAQEVLLIGSFIPNKKKSVKMVKTALGWEFLQKLSAGIHHYKFFIDGKEKVDDNNLLTDVHPKLGKSSVYVRCNHLFELSDYPDAKKVCVAGNFNDWQSDKLVLESDGNNWKLPTYLPDGTYAYKFIIDGNWITDPQNPILRPDESGNYNSHISIGDVSVFKLYGYLDAKEVRLAGNFNLWNYTELTMSRTPSGWELHYALSPGMYEYKFFVDNEWIRDPNNKHTFARNEGVNSLVSIKPNHIFKLNGFGDAKGVLVTGSFIDWDRNNLKMVKSGESWVFSIALAAGKHLYNFIVDGEIMVDPENPETEDAEFGQVSNVLNI